MRLLLGRLLVLAFVSSFVSCQLLKKKDDSSSDNPSSNAAPNIDPDGKQPSKPTSKTAQIKITKIDLEEIKGTKVTLAFPLASGEIAVVQDPGVPTNWDMPADYFHQISFYKSDGAFIRSQKMNGTSARSAYYDLSPIALQKSKKWNFASAGVTVVNDTCKFYIGLHNGLENRILDLFTLPLIKGSTSPFKQASCGGNEYSSSYSQFKEISSNKLALFVRDGVKREDSLLIVDLENLLVSSVLTEKFNRKSSLLEYRMQNTASVGDSLMWLSCSMPSSYSCSEIGEKWRFQGVNSNGVKFGYAPEWLPNENFLQSAGYQVSKNQSLVSSNLRVLRVDDQRIIASDTFKDGFTFEDDFSLGISYVQNIGDSVLIRRSWFDKNARQVSYHVWKDDKLELVAKFLDGDGLKISDGGYFDTIVFDRDHFADSFFIDNEYKLAWFEGGKIKSYSSLPVFEDLPFCKGLNESVFCQGSQEILWKTDSEIVASWKVEKDYIYSPQVSADHKRMVLVYGPWQTEKSVIIADFEQK